MSIVELTFLVLTFACFLLRLTSGRPQIGKRTVEPGKGSPYPPYLWDPRQKRNRAPSCSWRGYPIPGMTPMGCPNTHAPAIAGVIPAEVGRVEQVEGLGKYANPPRAPQREELRRPQVQDHRRVAPSRVQRDLLAGRRIDAAIVVGPIRVQVAAGRQIVRAGAGRLEHGRELDAVRQLQHGRGDHAMALVLWRRPPLARRQGIK